MNPTLLTNDADANIILEGTNLVRFIDCLVIIDGVESDNCFMDNGNIKVAYNLVLGVPLPIIFESPKASVKFVNADNNIEWHNVCSSDKLRSMYTDPSGT